MIKKWMEVINMCRDQTDLTYALHQVVVTIPAVKNINQRKGEATRLLKEWIRKSKQFSLGTSLTKAFELLAKGEVLVLPEESTQ